MGISCAPLIADLFLFCYERYFIVSLSYNMVAKTIQVFNFTSRYLESLLNIDNLNFESIMGRIYPTELQLNKTNASETEANVWIYIYLFQTDSFQPKFMISAMTLF